MSKKTTINKFQFLFKKINIVGLGLIGGSLAKSCKKYQLGEVICGCDIDQSQVDFAIERKIIDEQYNFNQSLDSELIIICTPLLSYEKIFNKIAHIINDNTLIIDVGSLKNFTLPLAKKILLKKAKNFVACHPIAGSEKSGVINSDGDLFLGKKAIICSRIIVGKINDERFIKKAQLFWQKIGSDVEFIDSVWHDKIFSLVSHLPQFLSFAAQEDFKDGDDEILNKHFRLQNSNPKIWQEIFTLNRQNIKYYLRFFLQNIDNILQNHSHKDDLISRRIALVSCFLALPDIKEFRSFSGDGFRDFTAIMSHHKESNFSTQSLTQFLNKVKSIINYEFK